VLLSLALGSCTGLLEKRENVMREKKEEWERDETGSLLYVTLLKTLRGQVVACTSTRLEFFSCWSSNPRDGDERQKKGGLMRICWMDTGAWVITALSILSLTGSAISTCVLYHD